MQSILIGKYMQVHIFHLAVTYGTIQRRKNLLRIGSYDVLFSGGSGGIYTKENPSALRE